MPGCAASCSRQFCSAGKETSRPASGSDLSLVHWRTVAAAAQRCCMGKKAQQLDRALAPEEAGSRACHATATLLHPARYSRVIIRDRLVRWAVTASLVALTVLLAPGWARAAGPLSWSAPAPIEGNLTPPPLATSLRTAVSCVTSSFCAAVDGLGDIITSTHPAAGASSWSTSAVATGGTSGVVCLSSRFCLIPDFGGGVSVSSDPTAGTAAWTRAQVFAPTMLGSAFQPQPSPATGISCPSVSLCVAVGYDVACGVGCGPSSSFVATATDPVTAPTQWNVIAPDAVAPSEAIKSVSCPAITLCVIAGAQAIASSTDPTGGAKAWKGELLVNEGASAVSCASTQLCVVVDEEGNALISTDPAAGPPSWRTVHLAASSLTGVSCSSTALCVAVDQAGDAYTTTDPTGTAANWSRTSIDNEPGGTGLSAVSCPEFGFCVAVDGAGHAIVGSGPSITQIAAAITLDARHFPHHVSLHALLAKRGLDVTVHAPTAGTATIDWYVPSRTGGREVLVGEGRRVFSAPASAKLRVEVTRRGAELLKEAHSVLLKTRLAFSAGINADVSATAQLRLR